MTVIERPGEWVINHRLPGRLRNSASSSISTRVLKVSPNSTKQARESATSQDIILHLTPETFKAIADAIVRPDSARRPTGAITDALAQFEQDLQAYIDKVNEVPTPVELVDNTVGVLDHAVYRVFAHQGRFGRAWDYFTNSTPVREFSENSAILHDSTEVSRATFDEWLRSLVEVPLEDNPPAAVTEGK